MIRKLCNVGDLPAEGSLKAFVDTRPEASLALCVGFVGSRPYAVANACPHQGAPLSAGHLEGTQVVCPIHGWRWDLMNGAPLHSGDPVVPAYEVRVYGSEVFVRVPDRRC